MISYIVSRIFQAVITLIMVSLFVFLVIRLLPGDPLLIHLGQAGVIELSEEKLAKLRHEYGLDKPLMLQYFYWVNDVIHGDLGHSIAFGDEVNAMIADSIPISYHIGMLAFLFSNLVGLTAGVICAVRRGKWVDTLMTFLANIGITVPVFWLGILMVYLFSIKLGWLPTHGYVSPFSDFWLSLKTVLMPAFCLSLFPMSSIARQTRSSILEVISQDYIRTAWAKGLNEGTIIFRHALKNGLIPIITLNGMLIRIIFGGAVVIETVFNVPGMGRLLVDAILNKDYPVIQGGILVIGIMIVLINLLVDISYGWVDPRIRYS